MRHVFGEEHILLKQGRTEEAAKKHASRHDITYAEAFAELTGKQAEQAVAVPRILDEVKLDIE